jgi:hypothetical protein
MRLLLVVHARSKTVRLSPRGTADVIVDVAIPAFFPADTAASNIENPTASHGRDSISSAGSGEAAWLDRALLMRLAFFSGKEGITLFQDFWRMYRIHKTTTLIVCVCAARVPFPHRARARASPPFHIS